MGDLVLTKGNEAVGEAAVRAGCKFFFGYPITPQNEIPEYMSWRLPEVGGVYLQAESEVAAINMVYGAAGCGGRVLISSSSPGISLMQEGISYLSGSELPCVIVNMMRGGPGLGSIQPAQQDYFQSVKGGGHGDYRLLVLAPGNLQELVDLVYEAFDLADKYRNPVIILGDGLMGQMMEPVSFPEFKKDLPDKPWATTGRRGRKERNVINSLFIEAEAMERHNHHLEEKFRQIAREVRYEAVDTDDAEILLVAYGTTARVALTAMRQARKRGIKAGLIRPITLWPFPSEAIEAAAGKAKAVLAVEMSMGQMVEDVRAAVAKKAPVHFFGRCGGVIPSPREVLEEIVKIHGGGGAE